MLISEKNQWSYLSLKRNPMIIKNFSPYKIVKEALGQLKDNERKVISGRFGIDENRKTLSAIGTELKLSRERIRQIEKDALRKLAGLIVKKDNDYVSAILVSFANEGGISTDEKIADLFLDEHLRSNKDEFNSLNLIFLLIPELRKIEKTKEMEDSWMLSKISKDDVVKVVDAWITHLEKVKKPLSLDVLIKAHPDHSKYEMTFLSELPRISKKIVKTESGHIGLASWPEVNPKNVRDKIYFVLKQDGKPLHFNTIAERINEQNFGKKKVIRATVHNELIADKRFVLVGRGIYALSEWGYKPGTVCDIIRQVLEDKKEGMKTEEILEAVLKQRTVKKNTILINLQTKKYFVKTGKDAYKLR